MSVPCRAVTKSVTVDRSVQAVYAFLSDLRNWPRWAVVNVLAVEPAAEPGWWRIATPDGPAEIRLHADAATGVLDHDFRDESGEIWTVPARVVPNGRGAEFLMTVFQPVEMDAAVFDQFVAQVDTEFATLRQVLEAT
jgi:hypothetical protein